jgi:ribonuclease R
MTKTSIVAEITDGTTATCLYGERARHPLANDLAVGTIVELDVSGAPRVSAILAAGGGARASLYRIAGSLGLDPSFSAEVIAEVASLLASPGIEDPSLVDLTALPFVTIDGPTSKDLDQAIHVEREGEGYLVRYALADAACFVKPGTALFTEALARGASFYFPGLSIPMLPRPLSEGIISLNPDGPRRALTFAVHLGARGEIRSTELVHARVRSRKKLAFGDVQGLYDAPRESPLSGTEMEESLLLLRTVGELRMADAAERDVVRYRRTEVGIEIDAAGLEAVIVESIRDDVELYNEQISLLVNAEGGRLLREHPSPAIQPIYRIHPAPDPDRLEELRRTLDHIAEAHGLPDAPWRWRASDPEESLALYLSRLPTEGDHERITRAIDRQCVLANLRSSYASEPGPHHGVGAEPYARFSAPMREIVGIFLHKQALELLAGGGADAEDLALRERVIESANRARDVQRRVNDLSNRLVLDRLFEKELARPVEERTRWLGTVMGLSGSKVHVLLDSPSIDVKIYWFDLGKAMGGAWLELADAGATLRVQKGDALMRVGDAVDVYVSGRDTARDRWVLLPDLA